MKRIALIFALVLAAACSRQESMEQLAARVFDVAGRQVQILAAALDSTQVPRTLNPDGSLRTSDYKWWCSGFFPGTLWYVYAYTGDSRFYDLAVAECAKIDGVQYITDGHDVGFMANCSFGNGLRIGGIEEYARPLANAAHNLAARFNPAVGCTLSWNPRKDKDWLFPVIIDNMMNLEILVRVAEMAGEPELLEIARSHANTTMKNHFRSDYTTWHVVDYDPQTGAVRHKQTHQGYEDGSTWARGEAWALYGYTMMAELTGDPEYLAQAEHIGRWTMDNLPEDGVQYWDYDAARLLLEASDSVSFDRAWAGGKPDGSIQRDASSAAITASAFVRLGQLTKDQSFAEECRAVAEKQIRALAGPEYLAEPGEMQGFLIRHCTGFLHSDSEVDVPLTYADYYFLEAVLRYIGLL